MFIQSLVSGVGRFIIEVCLNHKVPIVSNKRGHWF
jgi:hypothetical protein